MAAPLKVSVPKGGAGTLDREESIGLQMSPLVSAAGRNNKVDRVRRRKDLLLDDEVRGG